MNDAGIPVANGMSLLMIILIICRHMTRPAVRRAAAHSVGIVRSL